MKEQKYFFTVRTREDFISSFVLNELPDERVDVADVFCYPSECEF